MTQDMLDEGWAPEELMWTAPASEMQEVLSAALDLSSRRPEILARIEADQDALARTKKTLRQADQRWEAAQTADFPELVWAGGPEQATGELSLETGRPRMPAEVVYVFFVLQGYLGSVTDRSARDLLRESRTLHRYLHRWGLSLPGGTTILENVNAISLDTRDFVLNAQLEMILADGLDDFSTMIADSTAVAANSAWPTDGRMLLGLLRRLFGASQKLDTFGVANVRKHWVPRWLRRLQRLLFSINTATGKPHSRRKRKKYYRQFLEHARKILEYLLPECAPRDPVEEAFALPPSQRVLLGHLWSQVLDDLVHACAVYDYTYERIFADVQRPAREKMLSLADPSAAYIEKGGRQAVIGYKPQIARSGHGFVSALIVPEGNAADCTQLIPLVEQVHERTGVQPKEVSADDGYAVEELRDDLLEDGVERVCFSGPRGKRFIPEIDWSSLAYEQARKQRSAVESLIFVLKHLFSFGRLRRRGQEAVQAELLQKAIAFNFYRMVLQRTRAAPASQKAA